MSAAAVWQWAKAPSATVVKVAFGNWAEIDLQSEDQESLTIRIAAPLSLRDSSGVSQIIDNVSSEPADLARLLVLREAAVKELIATSDGTLRLVTEAGVVIVNAQPDYEAWELSYSNDGFVVALRGGEVNVLEKHGS
jgi:hypothetical protein